MKVIVIDENHKKAPNPFFDWLIYMIGYALVLITVSVLFSKTVYIDNSLFGLWGFLAAVIIFGLNKTIKPLLVLLTLPISIVTLGLFYPLINVFILKIADFILGAHFDIHGIFMPIIAALMISFMNILIQNYIIAPFLERKK